MASQQFFDALFTKLRQKLDRVEEGQCWLWAGGVTHAGGVPYGMMRVALKKKHSATVLLCSVHFLNRLP